MKKKTSYLFHITVILTIFIFSCEKKTKKAEENSKSIMVFAAASLTEVISEIVETFKKKNNVNIKLNLASSGTLARQIEQGEVPDIYISADKKWADYVEKLGHFRKGYKSNIAKNSLVFVAPLTSLLKISRVDSSLNLDSLLSENRLSMGDPMHVPAGNYAKEAIEYFDWYAKIKQRILAAKDVRSALMFVELEEAELGIIYYTDALKSKKIKILSKIPDRSHQPIVYVSGLCTKKKFAEKFFAYLNSGEAKELWKKHGFED